MIKIALINPESSDNISIHLEDHGFKVIHVPLCPDVAPPLAGHPDLQLFYHGHKLFCHSGMNKTFSCTLGQYAEVHICETKLTDTYPGDIAFNVACTGSYAFHRLDCTDPEILSYLKDNNVDLINVPQGYSKCSTIIVDEHSIITADRSIHDAAEKAGMRSLRIDPGHVVLPGYPYGFIGGTSGMYEDHVYFTGSLKSHPQGKDIENFIKHAGKRAVPLSEGPLIDLGSLIILPGTHQHQH